MSQVRPQLSVYGRWLLVQRVQEGRPVAHVAAELGVSRATGYKWWRRWREEGPAGLQSRSSRPLTTRRVVALDSLTRTLAARQRAGVTVPAPRRTAGRRRAVPTVPVPRPLPGAVAAEA